MTNIHERHRACGPFRLYTHWEATPILLKFTIIVGIKTRGRTHNTGLGVSLWQISHGRIR
jgi:hypothetical protein